MALPNVCFRLKSWILFFAVSLKGERILQTPQKFTGFMLVVEPSNDFLPSWVDGTQRGMMVPVSDYSTRNVGVFSLFGDTSTKFSDRCPNAIVQTSSIPKSDIQVLWTAPPRGSGCVVFRCVLPCDERLCCSCVLSECRIDRHHNWFCDWIAGWATRVEFFSVPKSVWDTPKLLSILYWGVKQPGYEA